MNCIRLKLIFEIINYFPDSCRKILSLGYCSSNLSVVVYSLVDHLAQKKGGMLEFPIFPLALLLRKPEGKLLFLLLGMILVLGPSDITIAKSFYFISIFFLSIMLNSQKQILELQNEQEILICLNLRKRFQILQFLQILIILSATTGALICVLPTLEILRGSVTSYLILLGIPIAIYLVYSQTALYF